MVLGAIIYSHLFSKISDYLRKLSEGYFISSNLFNHAVGFIEVKLYTRMKCQVVPHTKSKRLSIMQTKLSKFLKQTLLVTMKIFSSTQLDDFRYLDRKMQILNENSCIRLTI